MPKIVVFEALAEVEGEIMLEWLVGASISLWYGTPPIRCIIFILQELGTFFSKLLFNFWCQVIDVIQHPTRLSCTTYSMYDLNTLRHHFMVCSLGSLMSHVMLLKFHHVFFVVMSKLLKVMEHEKFILIVIFREEPRFKFILHLIPQLDLAISFILMSTLQMFRPE